MSAPKLSFNVVDRSLILTRPAFGIICLQGETLRGEAAKPVFITSSSDFERKLGGDHPDSDFPTIVKRLLDSGVTGVWVSRAHQYTDVDDPATAVGTKSTITLTVATESVVFTAKGVGPGYDGTVITVTDAASGAANTVDISVLAPGDDSAEVVRDIPNNPSAAEVKALNKKFRDIDIGTITNFIPVGSATLAGGVQDVSAITDADYVGTSTGKTGWYSFAGVEDAFRIANIHRPSPAVDIGLAAYCESRLTGSYPMVFHLGVPQGSNGLGWKDYRLGEGAFSHTPVDSWLGRMVGDHVEVPDPRNAPASYLVSGAADVLPLQAQKDGTVGPWFAAFGYKRGVVKGPSLGVEYNVGSPDNSTEFDTINAEGINAIIKRDNRVVYWGNRSLYLNKTSLLSKENIGDLVVTIMRDLRPLINEEIGDPNDPLTWKQIYFNVRPYINAVLVAGRAIRPVENQDWFWVGDQEVDDYREAKFNKLTDLDQGIYKVRFIIIPIAAVEQIAIDITVTDSNSLAFVVNENI